MSTPDPVTTVSQLIKAVNQGNLEAALACYESDAILIVQPGQMATGKKAIREAFAGFIAMQLAITTETYKIIQTGDLALFTSKWSATGAAPNGGAVKKMDGTSSDVLRRQPDGQWLIAIDNPFGAAILD